MPTEREFKDKDIAAARIQTCSDWEPLFAVLRDIKDIPGTPNSKGVSQVLAAEGLIEKINLFRRSPHAKGVFLNQFPRNLGIRDKIEQLIDAESSKAKPVETPAWDEQELKK